MAPEGSLNEFYFQMTESFQSLFDLTSRMDERLRVLDKEQQQNEEDLKEHIKATQSLHSDVRLLTSKIEDLIKHRDTMKLDSRVQTLEHSSNDTEGRWKVIVNFALQLIWVATAAYMLYKLGLQAPATP
jgi:chromosome segregation ATPase